MANLIETERERREREAREDQENIVTPLNGTGGTMGFSDPIWEGAENFVRSDEGGSFDPRIKSPKQVPWEEQKRLNAEAVAARASELRAKDPRTMEFAQQAKKTALAETKERVGAGELVEYQDEEESKSPTFDPQGRPVAGQDRDIMGYGRGVSGRKFALFTNGDIDALVPDTPDALIKAAKKKSPKELKAFRDAIDPVTTNMIKGGWAERDIATFHRVVGLAADESPEAAVGRAAAKESSIRGLVEEMGVDLEALNDENSTDMDVVTEEDKNLARATPEILEGIANQRGVNGDPVEVISRMADSGYFDGMSDSLKNRRVAEMYDTVEKLNMASYQRTSKTDALVSAQETEEVSKNSNLIIQDANMDLLRALSEGKNEHVAKADFYKKYSNMMGAKVNRPIEWQAMGEFNRVIVENSEFIDDQADDLISTLYNSGSSELAELEIIERIMIPLLDSKWTAILPANKQARRPYLGYQQKMAGALKRSKAAKSASEFKSMFPDEYKQAKTMTKHWAEGRIADANIKMAANLIPEDDLIKGIEERGGDTSHLRFPVGKGDKARMVQINNSSDAKRVHQAFLSENSEKAYSPDKSQRDIYNAMERQLRSLISYAEAHEYRTLLGKQADVKADSKFVRDTPVGREDQKKKRSNALLVKARTSVSSSLKGVTDPDERMKRGQKALKKAGFNLSNIDPDDLQELFDAFALEEDSE